MNTLPVEAFRKALDRSGLLDPAADASCRQAFESTDAQSAARRLVEAGVITKWQARQLLAGRAGPFFLGEYRLLARHEFPGPARAFSARHDPSGRMVHLIWLDRRRCDDADAWNSIVRRTTVAAQARSPVLSRTWALEQVGVPGQAADERILVCERVTGEPLADELARLGPLPLSEAGVTMHAIAAAVAELHAAGDVHGDLSLDGLVREPGGSPRSGRVRLLQFPMAGDPHRFPPRPLLGSTEEIAALGRRSCFVAPELMLPGAMCDARSDVYALGCMLQSLVSGSLPGWKGDPRTTLLEARTKGLPSPGSDVPGELATLIGYCTAANPATRYPSASELTEAIATCFGISDGSASAAIVATRSDATPVALRQEVGPTSSGGSRHGRRQKRPLTTEAWLMRVIAWMVGLFLAVMVGLTVSWRYRDAGRREQDVAVATPRTADSGRQQDDPAARDAVAALDPPPSDAPAGPGIGDAAARMESTVRSPGSPAVELVSGPNADGLPWTSPTSGSPPSFAYAAPGSQVALLVRLADLAGDPEGGRFLRALGPEVDPWREQLERLIGNPLAAVDLVQLTWQAGTDVPLESAAVIRLADGHAIPVDPAFHAERWGVAERRELGGESVLVGRIGPPASGGSAGSVGEVDLWLPSRERGRVLVVAPRGRMDSIIEASSAADPGGGVAVPLPAPVEQVAGMLDANRHVVLVGMPDLLRAGGQALFAGPLEPLAEPVLAFLGDDVQAAAVSLHFDREFYAEIDAVGTRAVQPQRLAVDLRDRFGRVPDMVEDYCAAVSADAFGRRLVLRLPGMLRLLLANLRSGVEGRGVVLNTRLPAAAGHNIALAAELALAQPPGRMVAQAAPAATPAAPENAAAKLRRKIDLSFARDTLEKSIELVSQEIGVPMEILGGDLELEGITQNQSFGLDETNQPAEAVLRSILAKADPAGKLVWVIHKRDGVEWVVITTREAAKKRGESVPPAATAEPP